MSVLQTDIHVPFWLKFCCISWGLLRKTRILFILEKRWPLGISAIDFDLLSINSLKDSEIQFGVPLIVPLDVPVTSIPL